MTRQPQSRAESESGRRSNVLFAGDLGTIAFGEKSPVGVTNNPSTILLWWMRLLGFLTMWNSYRATTPFVEKPWRSRFQVGYRPTTKSWSSNAPCTNLIAKLGECCHYGATATTTQANQDLIPTLKSFLKRHPDVVSAAVSLFPPGKILRPHKGPFKGVWRFHLPLYVETLENSTTSCELMIDGVTYYLQEGEGFLWDDTFLHSAVNRSEQPRVVLLFDVFRHDQPFWLVGMSWVFLWVAQIWQHLQNMRERALLR
jgi:hypothetical protein